MKEREKFGSRMGFILVSAGCAIGLGNVWKFPYMAGEYGGAAFILMYLLFLIVLGLPILVCEFSVGRASRKSTARAFHEMEPKGSNFHKFSYMSMVSNYVLMMFYTMVAGWMAYYCYRMAKGEFSGVTTEAVQQGYDKMLASPGIMTGWMIAVVILGFLICSLGVQRGLEKITKVMMTCLLVLIVVLAVRSLTLPGAEEGVRFYLVPNMDSIREVGLGNMIFGAMSQAFFTLSIGVRSLTLPGAEEGVRFYLVPNMDSIREVGLGNMIFGAMSQAFFTLSIGAGSMTIFGSYPSKDRSLAGESVHILVLDTFVATMAGLIVIPACFAYGVEPGAGPGLVFIALPNVFNKMAGGRFWGAMFFLFLFFAALSTVTAVFENIISYGMDLFIALPNVFNKMAGGRFWGAMFFLFLFFAALSTVTAVFENIISYGMDLFGWSRKKAVIVNLVGIPLLSLPAILGFNVLSGFMPFGAGSNIMDLEDFGWSRKKAVIVNLVGIPLLSLPAILGFNVLSGFMPFGAGSNIMDLEDFIVSNNILPLGSVVYIMFCVSKYGWGWDGFIKEVNTGQGIKFPKGIRFYMMVVIPVVIVVIYLKGYFDKFAGQGTGVLAAWMAVCRTGYRCFGCMDGGISCSAGINCMVYFRWKKETGRKKVGRNNYDFRKNEAFCRK